MRPISCASSGGPADLGLVVQAWEYSLTGRATGKIVIEVGG